MTNRDLIPRDLMARALANAERSRDFEELYLYDLREQIATHQKRLDRLRNDVARMKAWLDESDDHTINSPKEPAE